MPVRISTLKLKAPRVPFSFARVCPPSCFQRLATRRNVRTDQHHAHFATPFGVVVVKDGRDWMTAAKNMDKWHRGVERGAEALDSAWRRADLRQSNVQLQR